MAAQEAPAQQALALLVALLVAQQAVKTQYQLAVGLPEEVVAEEAVAGRPGEVEVDKPAHNRGRHTEQEEVGAHKPADIPVVLAAGLLARHKLEHPVLLYLCKFVQLAVANKGLYQPV